MIRHTLKHARSSPALRSPTSSSNLRNIHNSGAAPKPSHLLSMQNQYASLTVPVLKHQLKQRGLKLSGRKTELVDRLASFEAARGLSTSQAVSAKNDDSTIDYIRIPPKRNTKPKTKITIPVAPHVKKVAKQVENETPTVYEPDAAATSGSVHTVSGDIEVSSMNTDLGSAAVQSGADSDVSGTQVSSRDKTVLAGLAAAVAAWWGSKVLQKDSEKKA